MMDKTVVKPQSAFCNRKERAWQKKVRKSFADAPNEGALYVWALHVCGLTMGSSCGMFIRVCPLTIGGSCVPGIMALASCICWASIAIFFCWIRLFLPLISSWVFRWGGGCRYLQFSLEQRPWNKYTEVTKMEQQSQNDTCNIGKAAFTLGIR